MTGRELRTIAPRLCAAYDGLVADYQLAQHQHRVASDELLSCERCLAHRELQLVRAGTKGAKYQIERHRKLNEIRLRLRATKKARRLAWERLKERRARLDHVDRPFRNLEQAA